MTQLRQAEERLLQGIPGVSAHDVQVSIPAQEEKGLLGKTTMNMHYIQQDLGQEGGPVPLVCLPGYGLGAGAFAFTMEVLAETGTNAPFNRAFSLDWPGSGLCSPFVATDLKEREEEVTLDDLLTFATNALEAWRQALGIEKMVLLGHSLGGYLAFNYAERFPKSA